MDMHTLEINLDLKQNLNVYADCKQLDILHLVFYIFDDGVQADLSNYNVRLKAMKSDNVPLIQDTQYTVANNVVKIIAHEQLTTTSGITKLELQFMNKTTGEKKATFNLNLKIIASTLEIERSISTPTYTLLEELENKLDKALNLTENIDEIIEINNTLSTAITDATKTKNTLEIGIAAGNTLKTDMDNLNSTSTLLLKNLTDIKSTANTDLQNKIDSASKTIQDALSSTIDIKKELKDANTDIITLIGNLNNVKNNANAELQDKINVADTKLEEFKAFDTTNLIANVKGIMEDVYYTNELLTLTHDLNGYPLVQLIMTEYGAGIGGAGDTPAGGTESEYLAKIKIVYLDNNSLKIYVAKDNCIANPIITKIADYTYIVTFTNSVKSILIKLKE